jgi:hypothetical protein
MVARKRKAKTEAGRNAPNATYEPTAAEAERISAYLERRKSRASAPRIKVASLDERGVVEPDHPDTAVWSVALQAACGTTEVSLATALANQLLNALRSTGAEPVDEGVANAALAAMHAISPRDEIEAMLVSQMVATHSAAMDLVGRTRRAEYRDALVDYGSLATKLLRTYVSQLEALQRYRGKGQQKVTVEHVHVHQGGQAIVGNVEAGSRREGGGGKSEEQSHAKRLAHAPEPTVRCANEERPRVPSTRGSR